jgi:hypothetical protein
MDVERERATAGKLGLPRPASAPEHAYSSPACPLALEPILASVAAEPGNVSDATSIAKWRIPCIYHPQEQVRINAPG